jgi:hypothetical protein
MNIRMRLLLLSLILFLMHLCNGSRIRLSNGPDNPLRLFDLSKNEHTTHVELLSSLPESLDIILYTSFKADNYHLDRILKEKHDIMAIYKGYHSENKSVITMSFSNITKNINTTIEFMDNFHNQHLQRRSIDVYTANIASSEKLNHQCRVVVLADQLFQKRYGANMNSYITNMYNVASQVYEKEIGIIISLDKIVPVDTSGYASNSISDYLSDIGKNVRSGKLNVTLSDGGKPCLIHLLTFKLYHPALGLSFLSPTPDSEGLVDDTREPGGMCAEPGWNVLVTSPVSLNPNNQPQEVPFKSAVTTLLHEIGHTMGVVHREECCANINTSLGISAKMDVDPTLQSWIDLAKNDCQFSVLSKGGVRVRDFMSSSVIVGGTDSRELGVCGRAMMFRTVRINSDRWVKSGCLRPITPQ